MPAMACGRRNIHWLVPHDGPAAFLSRHDLAKSTIVSTGGARRIPVLLLLWSPRQKVRCHRAVQWLAPAKWHRQQKPAFHPLRPHPRSHPNPPLLVGRNILTDTIAVALRH